MNSTIPSPAQQGECPPWCSGGHLPSPGGVVHLSVDQVVAVTSPCGRESTEVYVCVEQVDGGEPAVRVEGATSAPMTPVQALQFATVLQALAVAATLPVQMELEESR